MNSLNSPSIDAGARTAIAGAEKKGKVETGASRVCKTGTGTLATGVALGLTDGGVVVLGLEGVELLERKDFWELLADLIGPTAASFLAMF